MKPAPAISTLAIESFAGSACTRASANLRGFCSRGFRQPHGQIAGEIAVLRIAGVVDLDARRRAPRRAPAPPAAPPARAAAGIRSGLFKGNPSRVQITKVGSLPQKRSIDFQRIDVDGPAQTRWAGQTLDQRQPIASRSAATWRARPSRSTDARGSDRRAAQSGRWRVPSTLRTRRRVNGAARSRRGAQKGVEPQCRSLASARSMREARVRRPAGLAALLRAPARQIPRSPRSISRFNSGCSGNSV